MEIMKYSEPGSILMSEFIDLPGHFFLGHFFSLHALGHSEDSWKKFSSISGRISDLIFGDTFRVMEDPSL